LFREAYNNDINNYKFIIISGSCIPLKSFNNIYNKLTKDKRGNFNICPPNQQPQVSGSNSLNNLLNITKQKKISKSSNWFILNRLLVEKLCSIEKDNILKLYFNTVFAPAEYFYYTYIKSLNLESEIITVLNSAYNSTTFAGWTDMADYKEYPESIKYGQPNNYKHICKEELEYLINSKSLFGRKFEENCGGLENLLDLIK